MLKARVPQPPRCGAKTEGNKRQRGSVFFGFFLLAKQKKETRMSRESDIFRIANKHISTYYVEMQTRNQIEDIVRNGLVSDIFRMESALFILEKIGDRVSDINDAKRGNFSELFGTLQRALNTEAILAVARIYDEPSKRYPTRCIKGVLKHLIDFVDELPEIREPYQLELLLKTRNAPDELINAIRTNPAEFPLLFSNYFNDELVTRHSEAMEKLKILRDKAMAHNENNSVNGPTWLALSELIEFAKYMLSAIGWAYLSMAYSINGDYILTSDAKRSSIAMSRLLQKIYVDLYPPK